MKFDEFDESGFVRNASQSAYLTTSGLAMTLTFDFLTSKSNQFIFVPNCTLVVNLVKFTQAIGMHIVFTNF